jgi:hypothetical protein
LGGSGASSSGQAEKAMKVRTGAHLQNPTLDLPCAVAFAFAAGQRPTEVIGPLLEDEAAAGGFLEGEGIVGLHRRDGVVLPLISRLC